MYYCPYICLVLSGISCRYFIITISLFLSDTDTYFCLATFSLDAHESIVLQNTTQLQENCIFKMKGFTYLNLMTLKTKNLLFYKIEVLELLCMIMAIVSQFQIIILWHISTIFVRGTPLFSYRVKKVFFRKTRYQENIEKKPIANFVYPIIYVREVLSCFRMEIQVNIYQNRLQTRFRCYT